MKMSSRLLRALALVVTTGFVIAGCALSPQTVPIEPTLAVDEVDVGHGRRMALEAVDSRTDRTLGTRGGIYADSSTISTEAGITDAVRTAMAEALASQGFVVVDPGAEAEMRMRVALEELTYEAFGDPVVRTVEIASKVSSTVVRGSETYTGRAGISKTRNVLTAPAPEDNEAYINDALALSLEKLLADPRYLDFIK
jgi:uncharacterized lipoprotein